MFFRKKEKTIRFAGYFHALRIPSPECRFATLLGGSRLFAIACFAFGGNFKTFFS